MYLVINGDYFELANLGGPRGSFGIFISVLPLFDIIHMFASGSGRLVLTPATFTPATFMHDNKDDDDGDDNKQHNNRNDD